MGIYGVILSRSYEKNARYQVDIELCGDMLASRKWILSLNTQFQEVIFMGSDNYVSVVFFCSILNHVKLRFPILKPLDTSHQAVMQALPALHRVDDEDCANVFRV